MTFTPLAFEVAHCSSSEDDHPSENLVQSSPGNQLIECTNLQDTDLANVKGKGWQTPKCPTYPQDLIIHLLCGPARISKIQLLSHHYKIATKVDIYIGLLKEGTEDLSIESEEDEDDTLIEFTRLGYICFDNNARAQFRARELKSIKINADGEYIRLVVRNCHQNRLNTYNQVGILALNILGYPLMHNDPSMQQKQIPRHLQSSLDESSMLSSSTRRTSVSSSHSITHGLSASGVVELELQHWISALLHAEELAVRDESYQKAKVYKGLSDQLNKFSKILSDFEQAKRLAVDTKDYDEAEKIKGDISEIKQTAEMIIKQSNITITDDGLVLPLNEDEYQQMLDNSLTNIQDGSASLQDQMYDEAIAKWTNFDTNKSETNNSNENENENSNDDGNDRIDTTNDVVDGHPNNSDPLTEMMNEISLSSKTSTSLASTDLAEMLMPPYLTSYHSEKGNPDHHHQPFPIISSSMSAKIERRKSLALEKSSQLSSSTTNNNTSLSSVHENIIEEEEEEEEMLEEEIIDPEAIPEDIMDEERGTYHDAIQLFGEEMVACVLSIKSKCRERGLSHIQRCIESAYQLASKQSFNQLSSLFVSPISHDHDLPSFIVNATLMMVQEAIMDSREAIVTLAIVIWQQLNDFYTSANIDALLISEWMNRTFSALLKRTGDSNKIIRNNATDLVIVLVYTHTTTTGTTTLLNQYVDKPDRFIHQHKEATARVQLVKRTFEELKLEEQGGIIPLNHIMPFIVTYLQHNHDDVKNESMNLLISVASVVELKQLSNYLDDNVRSALQQKLRTTTNTHLVPNKDSAVAELRALTVQSGVEKKQTVKKSQLTNNGTDKRRPASNTTTDKKKTTTTAGTKRTTTTTKRNQKTNTNGTTTTNTTKKSEPTSNTTAQESTVDPKENSMCIFCDEQNDQFNEQTLISHYYKDCPALTNCPMCQIIVEVSTLHSHILKDCEKRHLMKQCTRCKQAIPVEQWLQHTLKNTCTAYTNPDEVRCPLCLISIEPANEEGWRLHLLNGEGCPKNQRRQRHRDTTTQKKSTTTTTASSSSNHNNNTTTTKKSSTNNNGLDKKPSSTRIKQSSIKKK
ncbi:unnamed protein product [Cunninghamella blakesleeana]